MLKDNLMRFDPIIIDIYLCSRFFFYWLFSQSKPENAWSAQKPNKKNRFFFCSCMDPICYLFPYVYHSITSRYINNEQWLMEYKNFDKYWTKSGSSTDYINENKENA